jgi:transcriptional antiterminator RfaH
MFHWYALHTKPYTERRVALQLGQRDVEIYLPQFEKTLANQQKRMSPLFPGYLFARLDLDQGDSGWQWTPGLRYVVAYGEKPIPVHEEIIHLIEIQVHKIGDKKGPGHGFKPGDTVRVKHGPFQDMLAIFEGPKSPSDRVQILLNTLYRAVRVRIAADDLQKVDPPKSDISGKRPRRTRGRGRRIS